MNEMVRLRWWLNRGLHAHVSYPDGSWERRTWRGDPYWEIDALVRQLEREYGSTNVQVDP